MAESFRVEGPVRIPKTTEHHKISYQDSSKSGKDRNESMNKSSFQTMMEKDEERRGKSKITAEQIWERILSGSVVRVFDYERIPGIRWKNFPIDIFFRKEAGEKDWLNPQYLNMQDIRSDSPKWREMLSACRGNVILIHPGQWQKMTADLEYTVMMATECRSILALEYAGNKGSKTRCLSCVVGVDRFGVCISLFSTEAGRKREGSSPEITAKLRSERQKKTDKEHKMEFLTKLRNQKKGLERYRYDTLVMNRVKMTAKLFDSKAVHFSGKEQMAEKYFQNNEISIVLMELITGGL